MTNRSYAIRASHDLDLTDELNTPIATAATLVDAIISAQYAVDMVNPTDAPNHVAIECPGYSPLDTDIRQLLVLRGSSVVSQDDIAIHHQRNTLPALYRRCSHAKILQGKIRAVEHNIVQHLPDAWNMAIEYTALYINKGGNMTDQLRVGPITARVHVMRPSTCPTPTDEDDWDLADVLASCYDEHILPLRIDNEVVSLRRQIIALLDTHPELTLNRSDACIVDVDSVLSIDPATLLPSEYTIR